MAFTAQQQQDFYVPTPASLRALQQRQSELLRHALSDAEQAGEHPGAEVRLPFPRVELLVSASAAGKTSGVLCMQSADRFGRATRVTLQACEGDYTGIIEGAQTGLKFSHRSDAAALPPALDRLVDMTRASGLPGYVVLPDRTAFLMERGPRLVFLPATDLPTPEEPRRYGPGAPRRQAQ